MSATDSSNTRGSKTKMAARRCVGMCDAMSDESSVSILMHECVREKSNAAAGKRVCLTRYEMLVCVSERECLTGYEILVCVCVCVCVCV